MNITSKASLVLIALSTPAAHAADRVTLTVGGTVEQSCSITAPMDNDRTVAIDAAGSDTMDFAIDCNVPIKVSLKAGRGRFALDADKTPEHSTDYTSFVDYTAGFTLPIGSKTWEVSGQSGESLKDGVDFTPTGDMRNTPPFAKALSLTTSWNAPIAVLLAGTYRETITITVTGADPDPTPFSGS